MGGAFAAAGAGRGCGRRLVPMAAAPEPGEPDGGKVTRGGGARGARAGGARGASQGRGLRSQDSPGPERVSPASLPPAMEIATVYPPAPMFLTSLP